MKFELDVAQVIRFKAWECEQDAVILAKQREKRGENAFVDFVNDGGDPYYGAVGGSCSFTFTPTSIGDLVTVKHSGTGAMLDLTGDL